MNDFGLFHRFKLARTAEAPQHCCRRASDAPSATGGRDTGIIGSEAGGCNMAEFRVAVLRHLRPKSV